MQEIPPSVCFPCCLSLLLAQSQSLSVSVFPCPSVCLRIYLSVWALIVSGSLSLSVSLSLYHSVSLSLCLTLSRSLALSLSRSLALTLYFSLFLLTLFALLASRAFTFYQIWHVNSCLLPSM